MENLKKPESAVTATAEDTFKVSVEENSSIFAKKNAFGEYVGDNGERLFTVDEVTAIVKTRIDRFSKTILAQYGLTNFNELESLVLLANQVTNAVDEFKKTDTHELIEKQKEVENTNDLKKKLKIIGEWKFITISKIQRSFGMGFPSAAKLFNLLERNGIIYKGEKEDCFEVSKEKIAFYLATENI